MAYDWSSFSQKIKIKAPLQTIYDLWTTRRGIESWFLRMAEFKHPDGTLLREDEPVSKGDTYHWRWHGWPDSVEDFGEILEANGKDRMSFVFGKAGIVTVDLTTEDNSTLMTITQSNIPTDEDSKVNFHLGCSTGWTFYRCNMKAVVEGGTDIRNKTNNTEMND